MDIKAAAMAWFNEFRAFKPVGSRWAGTLKRVTGIVFPMIIIYFVIGPEAGHLSMVGSTTVVGISNGLPVRSRIKALVVVTITTSICMGLGAMSTLIPYAIVPMIFAVAAITTFAYHTILSGPPGPINFVLAAALGAYLVGHHGFDPFQAVLITFFAGVLSSIISMVDVFTHPLHAEKNAVADAERTVEEYETLYSQREKNGVSAVDPTDRLSTLRTDAIRRLGRAWSYLDEDHGIHQEDRILTVLRERLTAAHYRFTRLMEAEVLGDEKFAEVQLHPGDLGSPGLAYRIRKAISTDSQPFYAALRIGVATAVAAFLVEFLHIGHPYWAVFTAGLMLHLYPDRAESMRSAASRTVAEGVGLLLFAALFPLLVSTQVAFVIMIVLLYMNDYLKPRNAALAIVIMTPIALILSELGSLPEEPLHLIQTRALETVIGMVIALFALNFIGRGSPRRHVRLQYRALLRTTMEVLTSMAAGTLDTRSGRETRSELQYELELSRPVLQHARKDDPSLRDWLLVDRAVHGLGYEVMWLSWTDDPQAREAAAEALLVIRGIHDRLPVIGDEIPDTHGLIEGLCDASDALSEKNACRIAVSTWEGVKHA